MKNKPSIRISSRGRLDRATEPNRGVVDRRDGFGNLVFSMHVRNPRSSTSDALSSIPWRPTKIRANDKRRRKFSHCARQFPQEKDFRRPEVIIYSFSSVDSKKQRQKNLPDFFFSKKLFLFPIRLPMVPVGRRPTIRQRTDHHRV